MSPACSTWSDGARLRLVPAVIRQIVEHQAALDLLAPQRLGHVVLGGAGPAMFLKTVFMQSTTRSEARRR